MTVSAEPNLSSNADQISYWNDKAAITWTALQERIDTMFMSLTAVALDAAAPAPGERVVDVGCGCGATVLQLAHRVGAEGSVLGVDVSEPMAARARQRIAAAGLRNAEVLVSDAAAHQFEPASADLLFSRFGVMFFGDPAAAFANLRRAIRPGGRLAFAAWRPFVENAWFSVPFDAAAHLLPPLPPPEPDAPGPFAFANADRVTTILAKAGWTDIVLTRQDMPMSIAGPGQSAEAAEFATRLGALARALPEASPDLKERVTQVVADALRTYDSPDGIRLPAAIWMVTAKN